MSVAPVRVRGGASFPALIGTLTASTPLAKLTADDHRLEIDLRSRLLKRALRRLVAPTPAPGGPFWSATWEEIRSIDLAPRSVVIHLAEQRSCRFVVMRSSTLIPVLQVIEAHKVPTRRVSGTIRWFFGRDAWRG
jgi:hypothetical protein